MRRLLTLLIILIGFNTTQADCLACWELRKVEITLTNGEIISGYIEWNESWLGEVSLYTQWQNKFPESLIPYYKSLKYERKIILYKEIFIIKNDSIDEFAATKEECKLNLDYRKVKSVRELDKKAKRYHGADDLPVFTQEQIDKLKTNPFAMVEIDESVFSVFFLSYNPEITRKQLNKITENDREQRAIEFKNKGVIVYIIGYD